MILVDANVLIALVDPRQRLHGAATSDLKRLAGADLLLAGPVVSEVCFGLPDGYRRERTRELIRSLHMRPPDVVAVKVT